MRQISALGTIKETIDMLWITKRGLEMKNDEELAKIALNYRAGSENRMDALDRITDEMILARIATKLLDVSSDNFRRDKIRSDVLKRTFSRIRSGKAVSVLREPLLKMPGWSGIEKDFVRTTDDAACLLRLYRDEAEHTEKMQRYGSDKPGRTELLAGDIAHLKRCGVSNLEIAKATPIGQLPYYAGELIDEDVIRHYANNAAWIQCVRDLVPKETVLRALEGNAYRDKALFHYQIVDGVTYHSECEFGIHDLVLIKEERERRDDDQMRELIRSHYRCSRCGIKRVRIDDGWGRVVWNDEK